MILERVSRLRNGFPTSKPTQVFEKKVDVERIRLVKVDVGPFAGRDVRPVSVVGIKVKHAHARQPFCQTLDKKTLPRTGTSGNPDGEGRARVALREARGRIHGSMVA